MPQPKSGAGNEFQWSALPTGRARCLEVWARAWCIHPSWAVLLVDWVCSGSEVKNILQQPSHFLCKVHLFTRVLCIPSCGLVLAQLWEAPCKAWGHLLCQPWDSGLPQSTLPSEVRYVCRACQGSWVRLLGFMPQGMGWPCWESLTASLVTWGH